ncbi:hypothetical protein F4679DRAFT_545077 [Xylaria curta]|nr:hypothetical protein F4679DRAFT_545077 [Xylaria curta]
MPKCFSGGVVVFLLSCTISRHLYFLLRRYGRQSIILCTMLQICSLGTMVSPQAVARISLRTQLR